MYVGGEGLVADSGLDNHTVPSPLCYQGQHFQGGDPGFKEPKSKYCARSQPITEKDVDLCTADAHRRRGAGPGADVQGGP
jgi:hypothetical protein